MKNKTQRKIVLIGTGAVGTSFLYSAVNQGIANDYVLIDVFKDAAEGNALDIDDTRAILPKSFNSIKAGSYADCKDADIVVITAGRAQKPGETRLEMIKDNAQIMKSIATEIKNSGFNGITVIASNPVDALTYVYQKVTNFDEKKVIGSGTTLDSARLRRLLADKVNVKAEYIDAYLLGEHGDSSVAVWSKANIMGQPISDYINNKIISQNDLDEIEKEAIHMAYKIINLKRATFYGIGACLTKIVNSILNNEKSCLMIGAKLNGEYNNKDLYISVPAIVSANGCEKIIQWDINEHEQNKFNKSCETLKETLDSIKELI